MEPRRTSAGFFIFQRYILIFEPNQNYSVCLVVK